MPYNGIEVGGPKRNPEFALVLALSSFKPGQGAFGDHFKFVRREPHSASFGQVFSKLG